MVSVKGKGKVERSGKLESKVDLIGKLEAEAAGLNVSIARLRGEVAKELTTGVRVIGKGYEARLFERLTPELDAERVESLLPRPLWLECITISPAKAKRHLGTSQIEACTKAMHSSTRLIISQLKGAQANA